MTTKHNETEMRELSEQELDAVNGGGWLLLAAGLIAVALLVANDGK